MRTQIIAGFVAGAAALVISAPQAHADAELEILVNSSVVYDSGDTTSPVLSDTYSSGSITVQASALWSDGSMDLDNIDVNGAGHVQIIMSTDDNSPPGGLADLGVSGHDVSGSLDGTVYAYWDSGNALLATTTLVTKQLTLLGDQDTFGTINASGPFSMTEVVTITSGSGTISTDDSVTIAPDGGLTVALLGGAMMSLVLVRSKLK
jgi:hypothetical protein